MLKERDLVIHRGARPSAPLALLRRRAERERQALTRRATPAWSREAAESQPVAAL